MTWVVRGDAVIISMPLSAFDESAFVVDNAMWQEPVDGVAEYHGFDDQPSSEWDNLIYDMWANSNQTWEDSLNILRSIIYTKPMPPQTGIGLV